MINNYVNQLESYKKKLSNIIKQLSIFSYPILKPEVESLILLYNNLSIEVISLIKHQNLQKFASNADVAILILNVDDLVVGDTIGVDIENIIKDRKDFDISKQLIFVFNFLEKCSKEPSQFIPENEQNSSDCTQYFTRLAIKLTINNISE